MVTILSKPPKLEKIVDILANRGFPVFDMDMGRDEVEENKTFFIYNEEGNITPTDNRNQLKQEFVVMLVTREGKTIDVVELIEDLRLTGLIFDGTESEEGRLMDTDTKAEVITFNFHKIILLGR